MSSVEVSVTHEIKIGRESAWVKAAVVHDVDTMHQTYSEEFDHAAKLVARKVLDAIETTVESVREYERKNS